MAVIGPDGFAHIRRSHTPEPSRDEVDSLDDDALSRLGITNVPRDEPEESFVIPVTPDVPVMSIIQAPDVGVTRSVVDELVANESVVSNTLSVSGVANFDTLYANTININGEDTHVTNNILRDRIDYLEMEVDVLRTERILQHTKLLDLEERLGRLEENGEERT